MSKLFTIYRSSAGSGKTRTLAKEYLSLALRFRADYYKHILAVTFTNKATQEMKDRILAYLNDFATGVPGGLAEELKAELKLDDNTFRQYAQEAQAAILHQYSQFSISTIDAFFQKVIRSFTREAGLVGDYRLEVEQDAVLEDVIDNLIDELGTNRELTDWVVDFAKENLENERAWDVRYSLIDFAREIFREEFKLIEDDVLAKTRQENFFTELLRKLRTEKFGFLSYVRSRCTEALEILHANGLSESDFKYSGGVYNFFRKFSRIAQVKEFDEEKKGKRAEREFQEAQHWPDKATPHAATIIRLAEQQLIPLLNDVLTFRNSKYNIALSAEIALSNFYAFGLIADISRKLKEYKDENTLMLLADAPKFLNGVIQDSDTPFIYEKVGSFYRNYLIDEFQDTSGLQWRNFLPLLLNSLAQGYSSLVVGDVKQAIYRWRGGDLKLLQEHIEQHIGASRVEIKNLSGNYRSASAIVQFNNALFEVASASVAAETGYMLSAAAYHDVAQQHVRPEEGYVNIQFFCEEKEGPKWKDQVLEQLPASLEHLQRLGIALKDVAILVRKNEEGQQIVSYLTEYKNSERRQEGFRYDVVSNESLRLDGAASVNLLVSAMQYLLNTDDDIARARLAFEVARLQDPTRPLSEVFAVTNHTIFESYLPVAFTRDKAALKKLPLFELTETLVEIFKLGEQEGELSYLQAFQNLVLDFFTQERNDLGMFLEWWEDNKHKKSVQVSGEVDAAQIITIHKSKGLQFKYVLIPFCAWALDHEMMHAPQLWVQSQTPPFDQAGFIPVRYSSALAESLFEPFYTEERSRTYLDNLNLLYVALTRAERGMIVFAPHPDVRNAKKTVAQILYGAVTSSTYLRNYLSEAKLEFCMNTPQPEDPGKTNSPTDTVSLSYYPSAPWRGKLVIRQTAPAFFTSSTGVATGRRLFGIHTHTVLARIRYIGELPETLKQMVREGIVTQVEADALQLQLNELFTHPVIHSWFTPEWEVRTEVPVLLPGGKENRIDRLLRKDRRVVVIDFKTGMPARADQRQVQEYIDVLRLMNYAEVEGYLLYLATGEVVPVPVQHKTKLIRKKDVNQLDLGLG